MVQRQQLGGILTVGVFYDLYEVSGVSVTETESRMVINKGWGREKRVVNRYGVLLLQDEKVLKSAAWTT